MLNVVALGLFQVLAQQIKACQSKINNLCEKSHDLAERSADLGPLCARKLYHTGERETRVIDLVNMLNAPLEPYVSPLGSPTGHRHTEQTIRSNYENPLKLFRDLDASLRETEIHLEPVEADVVDNLFNVPLNDSGVSKKSDTSFGSLPSISPRKPFSGSEEKVNMSGSARMLSSPSVCKTSPEMKLKSKSTPNVNLPGAKFSTHEPGLSSKYRGDSSLVSPYDSGVNFSTPSSARSKSTTRGPVSSLPSTETMEVAVDVSKAYSMPPKRAHSRERVGLEHPKPKSLRSSGDKDSFDGISVRSGSTDDPRSSVTRSNDFEDTTSLSSQPITVSEASTFSRAQNEPLRSQVADKQNLPKDFKQRKEEALTPYQPRSNYLKSKLHGDTAPDKDKDMEKDYFATLANDLNQPESQPWKTKHGSLSSKGPIKGDHSFSRQDGSPSLDREAGFLPGQASRRSYLPRSPSPLTLNPTSRSHHDVSQGDRSRSSETPGQRSSSYDKLRGHRSLSPQHVAMETSSGKPGQEGPMSKTLTAAQIRGMGGGSNTDKLAMPNKGTWDPVGAFLLFQIVITRLRGFKCSFVSIGNAEFNLFIFCMILPFA